MRLGLRDLWEVETWELWAVCIISACCGAAAMLAFLEVALH